MPDPTRFLRDLDRIDSGQPGAVLLMARYDAGCFDPALFTASGIALPAELSGASERRQCEFLAGRLLAARALALLNLPPATVGRAPDRRPVWPHGLAGSISHARGFAACLVAPAGDPGADVETLARDQALAALRRHALTAADQALLADEDPALVSLIFSAKETLFKALYPSVGRSFGFDAAELAALPGDSGLTLRLTRDLAPGLSAGQRFDIRARRRPDHVLTWMQHLRP